MGKSTISMAMFNSQPLVTTRPGNPIEPKQRQVLHFKERLELATQKLQLGHEELQDDENAGLVGWAKVGNRWEKTR